MKKTEQSRSRDRRHRNRLFVYIALPLFLAQFACQGSPKIETDLSREGYAGPVRGVLIESVGFGDRPDGWGEIQQAASTILYDEAGKRTLTTPFKVPLPGGFAELQYDPQFNFAEKGRTVESPFSTAGGKWIQRFDDKGNLIEKTLIDPSGATVSKLTTTYVYDARGNWIDRETKKDDPRQGAASGRTIDAVHRSIYYRDSNPPERLAHTRGKPPQDAKARNSSVTPTPEELARGQSIYYQRCASCHGEDGKAKTEIATVASLKPADLTTPESRSLTDGELFWKLSEADSDSKLPALNSRLPDADRWRLVHYLRLVQKGQKLEAPALAAAEEEEQKPSPKGARADSTTEQRYSLRGKVISIDKDAGQVTIEHEEIKGYMGGMTMPFPVPNKSQIEALKPGDRVEGTLVVAQGWRLENLKPIKP